MVAVLHGAPESASPEALAAWNAQVGHALAPADRAAIAAIAEHARELYGDRCTADGEPWLDRATTSQKRQRRCGFPAQKSGLLAVGRSAP